MKRFYILAALCLFAGGVFSANALDMIILRDGNVIDAKVVEISPTEIRYRRADNLNGPVIVIPRTDVLSIKFENGTVDIINTVPAAGTGSDNGQGQNSKSANETFGPRNPRFNSIGASLGYLGISNFGFSVNGTVSPAAYTFFDFSASLGFANFSFNGNANFCGFVPFNNGGWYGGAGLNGGAYEFADSMNGFFSINAITGFIFFNWLNVNATLQMMIVPEFAVKIKPMVGYVYRFQTRNDSVAATEESKTQKPAQQSAAWSEQEDKPVALKFSLGLVFGVFGFEGTGHRYLDNADWSWSGSYLNLIEPILSLRLLFSLENKLRLGIGTEMAYSLVKVQLTSKNGGFSNESGYAAFYGIIGYGNMYLHAGYDYWYGALFLAPAWAINKHLLIGLPMSLFGSNQRRFSFIHSAWPPDQYDGWGHYTEVQKTYHVGLSIQWVF